jgi:hypothetical protein
VRVTEAEEEAANLLAVRAEAEALAARTEAEVRGAGGAAVEAEEVEPEYEVVAELLRRLELVEYLPLCLENELEDGASYFGTSLESVLLTYCVLKNDMEWCLWCILPRSVCWLQMH